MYCIPFSNRNWKKYCIESGPFTSDKLSEKILTMTSESHNESFSEMTKYPSQNIINVYHNI